MRADGKPEGLRQSMSWLHTYTGLLLGWLLYAIFYTGTFSYFRNEVNDWMRPELHGSVYSDQSVERAIEILRERAPEADSWSLTLPGPRRLGLSASARGGPAVIDPETGRAVNTNLTLDAASGEPVSPRRTNASNFYYRFHYELHWFSRQNGRLIVGIATMLMFIAIISGVITHKKIFSDFFTFRPKKGQRSWLDAHNAVAVLALPFHIIITFSGLLLIAGTITEGWTFQGLDGRGAGGGGGGRGAAAAPQGGGQGGGQGGQQANRQAGGPNAMTQGGAQSGGQGGQVNRDRGIMVAAAGPQGGARDGSDNVGGGNRAARDGNAARGANGPQGGPQGAPQGRDGAVMTRVTARDGNAGGASRGNTGGVEGGNARGNAGGAERGTDRGGDRGADRGGDRGTPGAERGAMAGAVAMTGGRGGDAGGVNRAAAGSQERGGNAERGGAPQGAGRGGAERVVTERGGDPARVAMTTPPDRGVTERTNVGGGNERGGQPGGVQGRQQGAQQGGPQGGGQQGRQQGGQQGGGGGTAAAQQAAPREPIEKAPMASIVAMLREAERRWDVHGVNAITINNPDTVKTMVSFNERSGNTIFGGRGGGARTMRFNGVTGELVDAPPAQPSQASVVSKIRSVLTGIHEGRFAGVVTRWLLFMSGVLGTFMAASGMVLWVVKRLPERKKLGFTPIPHRVVELLNVGAIAGLSVAFASMFWLNRILPADMATRGQWEVWGFFWVWGACFVYPLLVTHRTAWLHQMSLAALLYGLLPILNPLTGGASLVHSIANGQWSIANVELVLVAMAALHGGVVWWLLKKPATKAVPGAAKAPSAGAKAAPAAGKLPPVGANPGAKPAPKLPPKLAPIGGGLAPAMAKVAAPMAATAASLAPAAVMVSTLVDAAAPILEHTS